MTTHESGQPVTPAIWSTAWITGVTRILVHPSDPFPQSYLLSDTWPRDNDQR